MLKPMPVLYTGINFYHTLHCPFFYSSSPPPSEVSMGYAIPTPLCGAGSAFKFRYLVVIWTYTLEHFAIYTENY
jgi:hypothetical protein